MSAPGWTEDDKLRARLRKVFGVMVRHHRARRFESVEELAAMIYPHDDEHDATTKLAAIEDGAAEPSLSELVRLADAFDITLSELMTRFEWRMSA